MQPATKAGLFLLIAMSGVLVAQENPVRTYTLDERRPITIGISVDRVTTFRFPGVLQSIDAANVTTDGKTAGAVQLGFKPGNSYFSVKSLQPGASASLNVGFNGKTFVFELVESNAPALSVILEEPAPEPAPPPFVPATIEPPPYPPPATLLAALDLAKSYEHQRQMDRHPPSTFCQLKPTVSDYGDFQISAPGAYCLEPHGLLVFPLAATNKTAHAVRYLAQSISIQLGTKTYYPMLTEADGVIAPRGQATLFLVVPVGRENARKELSPEQRCVVQLTRPAQSVVRRPPGKPL